MENSIGSFSYGSAPSCTSSYDKTCDENGENCTSTCDGGSCSDGATLESIASAIAKDKADGEAKIKKESSIWKAISDYNACTTGWINTFLFKQN